MTMRLTRRDAISVLVTTGVLSGAKAADLSHEPEAAGTDGDSAVREATLRTLVDLAEVLYPTRVEGVETFVRRVSGERLARDEARRAGVRDAIGELEAHARILYDEGVDELEATQRDRLLVSMGVATADPRPDGTAAERVRYYLVNELLYTLYTSPTGAELVGLENPQGHAGGLESYRRGPEP